MKVEILHLSILGLPRHSVSGALAIVLLLVAGSALADGSEPVTVRGTVRDENGAAIAGAQVELEAGGRRLSSITGPGGEFQFDALPARSGMVEVSAIGFSPAEEAWSAASGVAHLSFVLKVSAAGASIVVSATRSSMKLSDVPGSAVELSTSDVAATPALALDDMLRQVPGFSLFRRTTSRVANPTTQGVSLRGLGASGPSRALVLEDGIPFVDPFGGWIYWDRAPRAEISSLEVFRGGSSNLYGSDALGGVVEILTRVPRQSSLSLDFSYGNQMTPDLSIWAGTVASRWDFASALDMSRTDGYILVPASQRGTVDTAANSEHVTLDTTAGYRVAENTRLSLRSSLFEEYRHNGTPLQKNSTSTGFWVAGLNAGLGARDYLTAHIYGEAQGYDQTFSSIASDRNSERLTDIQHVPSQQIGGDLVWNHAWRSHTFVAGVDVNQVMGASDEQLFSTSTGNHMADNIAGGKQLTSGIFGEDIFRHGDRWIFIAGARWDDWSNFDGSNFRLPRPVGTWVGTQFKDRSNTSFSPRFSVLHQLPRNLSLSVSAYRAFRAPTLNELYRSFQQGTVFTASNALLRAERLTGSEAGIRALLLNNKIEGRGTVFWSDIVNPVTNVTLSTTPTLTTRQRQNLGRTRSLGTELDGSLHLSSSIELSAGYQYTHATVVSSVPVLVGLNVPEVPRHQFSWQARYWNPERLMISLQGRYSSQQFDDDLNTLPLQGYYVMDVLVGRRLLRGVEVYAAAENMLNQRYPVALSPAGTRTIKNLGPPILGRAGLRVDLPIVSK
jgi:outer membrane receptor protein involved in Fe transport